jgi:membrane-bound ClpP family serine protease
MSEGFDWRAALRRAALMTGFYWLIVYGMSVAFPENFGLSQQNPVSLVITTVLVFVMFTIFTAFTDRARRRRMQQQNAKNPDKKSNASGDSENGAGGEPGPLKGRPNPNASRKKTRRKR